MKIYGYRSKKKWKMLIASMFYALVAIIIVIAIINPSSSNKSAKASIDQTSASSAQSVIEKVLGKATNTKKDTFISAENSQGYLTLDLNASDNMSKNLIKSGMLLNTSKIIPKLFDSDSSITEILIDWHFNTVDPKGNTGDAIVMKIDFKRDNSDSINWKNVITKNLPTIANSYWDSGAFN